MRRREPLPDPTVVAELERLDAALSDKPGADDELLLLAAGVRAARPQVDPGFAARLDGRVAQGFERERGAAAAAGRPRVLTFPAPRRMLPVMGVAAALLVGVTVVALQTGDSEREKTAGEEQAMRSENDTGAQEPALGGGAGTAAPPVTSDEHRDASGGATAGGAGSLAAPPVAPAPAGGTRKVERSARLELSAPRDEVQQVADGVVRETQAAGGYVQHSQVAEGERTAHASFILRVPARRLDDALRRLSRLANVTSLSQDSNDITGAVTSVADRLADARAQRRALLRALGRATTDRQVRNLRERLRLVRSEISRLRGDLGALRRRADLSTVDVAVRGRGRAEGAGGGTWTPGDALRDAGRVLEVAAGVLLVGAAAALPVALLALLAYLAARTVRRRRREAALARS